MEDSRQIAKNCKQQCSSFEWWFPKHGYLKRQVIINITVEVSTDVPYCWSLKVLVVISNSHVSFYKGYNINIPSPWLWLLLSLLFPITSSRDCHTATPYKQHAWLIAPQTHQHRQQHQAQRQYDADQDRPRGISDCGYWSLGSLHAINVCDYDSR